MAERRPQTWGDFRGHPGYPQQQRNHSVYPPQPPSAGAGAHHPGTYHGATGAGAASAVPAGTAAGAARAKPSPQSIFAARPPTGDKQQLWNNNREREVYDDMAAVFSLLTATERLENIWARRGAMSQEDYETQCQKLIHHYTTMRHATEQSIPNLDLFIAEYRVKANMARPRLQAGVPATVLPPSSSARPKDLSKFVMRGTNLFHQINNCIELNQLEVHVILPDIKSLFVTLERILKLGHTLDFLAKLKNWIEKLNAMPAGSRLSEEEGIELKLALDSGFREFEDAFND